MSSIAITPAILKSALAIAVNANQCGESFAQSIDNAVKHIRARQPLSMLEEARAREWLQRELPNALQSKESKPVADEIVSGDQQLYQRTGPTRFLPVGKPPFIFPPLALYRVIDGRATRKLPADCLQRRKIIAVLTSLVVLLAGIFPPWIQTYDLNDTHTQSNAGYAFIATPPQPRDYDYSIGVKLDTPRLVIEMACVLAAGVGAWFVFGGEKSDSEKK